MKTIKLKKIVIKILKKYGFNNYNAKLIAEILIYAEFVNASSHGVSRLSMYCNRIKKKLIDPKGKIKIKNISNNISLIDSNNNIGFIGAYAGIKQSIAKAKKYGVSLVAVKNSGHYGLSSYYIDKAVKSNLISFCFTNAPPAIAPYGAKKSLFGTNPIAFGAPIKNKPAFIFDSSMSKINRGKIRIAAKLGKKIPYGVALDKFGKITTDPKKALKNADLIVTDTWYSMHQTENEREIRKKKMQNYTLTEELLKISKNESLVFHCMPIYRNNEIMSDIVDKFFDIFLKQAENRLHVQKGIMHWCFS